MRGTHACGVAYAAKVTVLAAPHDPTAAAREAQRQLSHVRADMPFRMGDGLRVCRQVWLARSRQVSTGA